MSERIGLCCVAFVAPALGLTEVEIMDAIRNRGLMTTGGRSARTAKVYVADVVRMFKVDVRAVFGLSKEA